MSIGEHLRSLRIRRGWSLARLSLQVHYSKSYLSRVENGLRPLTPELAERCDRALDSGDDLARLARDRPRAADPAPAVPGKARTGSPVPAQLPAVGRMWGREAEVEHAEAFLAGHSGPAVIAVDGMGGVGKTTFAVALAGGLARSWPEGALFADLGAHGPSGNRVAPEDVATGLLHALGQLPQNVPGDPVERMALVRSMLAERRVIVVLDDATGAAQVAPLLPAVGGSLVIVTGRRRLTALSVRHGALRIALEPLAGRRGGGVPAECARRADSAGGPGGGPPARLTGRRGGDAVGRRAVLRLPPARPADRGRAPGGVGGSVHAAPAGDRTPPAHGLGPPGVPGESGQPPVAFVSPGPTGAPARPVRGRSAAGAAPAAEMGVAAARGRPWAWRPRGPAGCSANCGPRTS
ncbi:hypothetical protein GCM10020221_19670 [Streptomyces thioluteus]|uniref:HTH cro/C1-type domain-containing protein n=1 Tax=Streptomyces thioluteus TaxID=66431 RepID=A0ABN3WSD8_STRTU